MAKIVGNVNGKCGNFIPESEKFFFQHILIYTRARARIAWNGKIVK